MRKPPHPQAACPPLGPCWVRRVNLGRVEARQWRVQEPMGRDGAVASVFPAPSWNQGLGFPLQTRPAPTLGSQDFGRNDTIAISGRPGQSKQCILLDTGIGSGLDNDPVSASKTRPGLLRQLTPGKLRTWAASRPAMIRREPAIE